MAVTWKKLALDDEVVRKNDYDAYSILYADTDNTPAVLTVEASTIVGRKASGGIVALTATEVRTIINVEDGADVTDVANVTTAHNSINVNEHSDITSAGSEIEDAVTKKHSQNTDTQLDSGELEIDADDCVKIKETAYFDAEYDNGSSGSAKTINWKLGNKQKITLTADCTISFTAPSGPCNLILKVIQDSTAREITWPGTVQWPDGDEPELSEGSADIDLIALYFDGTNYFGVVSYNFS